MKIDPHDCPPVLNSADEHRGWAFVHDLFAHPAMALSGYSAWSRRFHAFTSLRAWPNQPAARRARAAAWSAANGRASATANDSLRRPAA